MATRKTTLAVTATIAAFCALLPLSAASQSTQTQVLPAGWNLVSVPLQPTNPEPPSVFGGVSPLDLYDYILGQLLGVDEGLRNLSPGRANWILLPVPTTVQVTGSPVSTATPFGIAIVPGWNLIASPWLTPVSWSDAQVSVTNAGSTAPLTEAAARNWIESVLHTADGGSAATLDPWSGYLLFSNVTATLVFAPPASAPVG